MRIMIASVAPWAASGYGTQTAKLARSLKNDKHEVAIAATFGSEGGVTEWEGIKVFPSSSAGMSQAIAAHALFWQPDIVISLMDLWPLGEMGFPFFRWISWLPVDHDPLSPSYVEKLKTAWKVVAISEHGKKTLNDAGVECEYIPHGISKNYFQDNAARKAFRESRSITKDKFVFGIVGVNAYWPSRKGFDRLFEAYTKVHEAHPDTLLYVHATKQALSAPHFNLEDVMAVMGVSKESVIFTDDYPLFIGYDEHNMRAMYNGFDCFVLPTQGEGFGLPLVEAQACGVPVIATDCTSVPQLTEEDMRILVPARRYLGASYGSQFDVDPIELEKAMNKAYEQLKDECPCRAGTCDGWPWRRIVSMFAKNYDWDHVYTEYWRPFLSRVEREIKTPSYQGVFTSDFDTQKLGGDTACDNYLVDRDGEMVVLKVDSGGYYGDLRREAEMLSTLSHPNIPAMLEYGKNQFDRDYMITEYRGEPLTPIIIAEHGNEIYKQIQDTLGYLHSVGIVHRDVKLDNIVWNGEKASLVDFGWAKYSIDLNPDYNATGDVTPGVAAGIVTDTGLVNLARVLMPTDGLLKRIADSPSTGLPVPYHEMGLGVPAERDCQTRWDIMNPDVKDKTVLDIGCNMGWFVKKSLDEGAKSAVGIDKDAEIVKVAKELVPDGMFFVNDVDTMSDELVIGDIDHRGVDVVFALSIIMHLKNRENLWKLINEQYATEVYFEPPRELEYGSKMSINDWIVDLSNRGWDVEYRGGTDRDRPLFYLRRYYGTNG